MPGDNLSVCPASVEREESVLGKLPVPGPAGSVVTCEKRGECHGLPSHLHTTAWSMVTSPSCHTENHPRPAEYRETIENVCVCGLETF